MEIGKGGGGNSTASDPQWWLAYTFVCVDVTLAVGAGVRHILQVVDQTGNQAAAQIAPERNGIGIEIQNKSSYHSIFQISKRKIGFRGHVATSFLHSRLLKPQII